MALQEMSLEACMQPGNGKQQMNRMMVTRTVSLPLAVGGG
jgi:hypothetical protein